jgi:hypothetical protein
MSKTSMAKASFYLLVNFVLVYSNRFTEKILMAVAWDWQWRSSVQNPGIFGSTVTHGMMMVNGFITDHEHGLMSER